MVCSSRVARTALVRAFTTLKVRHPDTNAGYVISRPLHSSLSIYTGFSV